MTVIKRHSVPFAVSVHLFKQLVIVGLIDSDCYDVGQEWRTHIQSHVQLDKGHTDLYVTFHQD